MTERTAEDWGRLSVSLPGWRWMPGMLACSGSWSERVVERKRTGGARLSGGGDVGCSCCPDPDDPATEGCLWALLGGPDTVAPEVERYVSEGPSDDITSLGRACIAAAAALGRWPGGEE